MNIQTNENFRTIYDKMRGRERGPMNKKLPWRKKKGNYTCPHPCMHADRHTQIHTHTGMSHG